MIAPLLDLNKSPSATIETGHQVAGQLVDGHDVLHQNFTIKRRYKVIPVQLLLITQNSVNFLHVSKFSWVQLRRAAGNNDSGIRSLSPGLSDRLARLTHRFISNGASVDDHRIAQPGCLRLISHHLRLIGVQATAEIDYARITHVGDL